MTAMVWRLLMAVLAFAITMALIPPVLRVLGLGIGSDLLLIIRICLAALAVLYVVRGGPPSVRA